MPKLSGPRKAKAMPMTSPKKKSSVVAKPAKAQKPKKTSNMTPWRSVNDRLADAERQATGAKYQIKVNRAKGKLDNFDYRASKTEKQRTADLNRLNDTSKTLGRAKNVVSKQTRKAKTMKDIVSGKYKG
jgi:hypothetical protein